MSDSKILLVEDEENFGSVLTQYLKLSSFDVFWAKNGSEAWSLIKTGKPFDCCILDVMMPEMDGITLGKEIKSTRPDLPFIYLTAKSLKQDVIEGFRAGADDYVTKPFDTEVLVYKLRALLQRVQDRMVAAKEYAIGRFTFNPETRLLMADQKQQRLTPKECAILLELATAMNRVVSREKIVLTVWGEDNYFNRRSMDVYMSRLRKYLKSDPGIQITSLHAGGYMLHAEV